MKYYSGAGTGIPASENAASTDGGGVSLVTDEYVGTAPVMGTPPVIGTPHGIPAAGIEPYIIGTDGYGYALC